MGTVSDLRGLAGAKSTPDAASAPAPDQKSADHSASRDKMTFADLGARIGEDNEALRSLLIDTSHQLSTIDDLKDTFGKLVDQRLRYVRRARTHEDRVVRCILAPTDRPVAELSAGQRERAALARAVAVEPRVIVADEPTARLDGANALALGALLAEVARTTGATVICATHDPLLIEQADAELSLGSR